MKRIMIVAAHPDDEILGCGGYIINQRSLGNIVNILYLSEGVTARFQNKDMNTPKAISEISKRKEMAIKCSEFLNFQILDFLDYENLRMHSKDTLDLVKIINNYINIYKPDTILCNHSGDLNSDHRVAFEATYTALRPFTIKKKYVEFITYEVVSSTNWSNKHIGKIFSPNYYLDISKYIKTKKLALEFYKKEMRKYPHTRSWKSILNFHHIRGAEVGLEYAEAYEVIKKITK